MPEAPGAAERAPQSRGREGLELAAEELAAARSILADEPGGEARAARHLLAGWRAIGPVIASETGCGEGELPRTLFPEYDAPAIQAALAGLRDSQETLEREELELLVSGLGRAVRAAKTAAAWCWARELCLRHKGAALACLALVAVAGVASAVGYASLSRPWRAIFYSDSEFGQKVAERQVRHVDFDWLSRAPMALRLPRDQFSVRFDSCLALGTPTSLRFALGADEGARFYIDGVLVIDNWGRYGYQLSPGREVEMRPGIYHLRVDYFDRAQDAKVHLLTEEPGGRRRPFYDARVTAPDAAGRCAGSAWDPGGT